MNAASSKMTAMENRNSTRQCERDIQSDFRGGDEFQGVELVNDGP